MKISEFQIKNFKCFQDTGFVQLSDGMNIVCGQNNAGKTALLQALGLNFPVAPHRSMASLPRKTELGIAPSEVQFTLTLTGEELGEIIGYRPLRLELPPQNDRGSAPFAGNYNPDHLKSIWEWLIQRPRVSFKMRRVVNLNGGVSYATRRPSHDMFLLPRPPTTGQTQIWYLSRDIGLEGIPTFRAESRYDNPGFPDIAEVLSGDFLNRIYRFSAERFGLGESQTGTNRVLAPDASNLPEVLNLLQSNPASHEEFISLLREILPQIQWINVEPLAHSQLRVNVWTLDKKKKRDDLAIPLSENGTGIGQVLSILYVAFSSEHSRVLLIDEPQSFLHPGAARKLVEVLKRFHQHQYIVSTHSAAIIAAADAPEVLILRSEEGRSNIAVANTRDNEVMQSFLEEVGTRLSDVFGMDRVLWVEGPTEERAFPLLLASLGRPLAGTAIVSVRNTGDLEGRNKKKIFEIYNNLTGKACILPPAVAFILDSETRNEEKKSEISKLSGDRVRFLPRRTFENYLMYADAICAITNGIDGFTESGQITEQQVNEYLETAMRDPKYWAPEPVPENPSLHGAALNCASILADLFTSLSECRVTYRKVDNSVSLFKWLLEHDRDRLADLSEFLTGVLGSVQEQS